MENREVSVSVEVRKSSDSEFTKIDYSKKYFTDYNQYHNPESGENKRNTIYHEENLLEYQYYSQEQKARRSEMIFEKDTSKKPTKNEN